MLVNFNPQWILPGLLRPEQFLEVSTACCERKASEETGVAYYAYVGIGLNNSTKIIADFHAVGM